MTFERTKRRHQLSRSVNTRIREVAESLETDQPVAYLCECGRVSCSVTLELTCTEFDSLLTRDECFLVAPTHAGAYVGERIRAENGRFVLVAEREATS